MPTLKNVKINNTMEADEMNIDIDDLLMLIANDHKPKVKTILNTIVSNGQRGPGKNTGKPKRIPHGKMWVPGHYMIRLGKRQWRKGHLRVNGRMAD